MADGGKKIDVETEMGEIIEVKITKEYMEVFWEQLRKKMKK